jgi:hypothetical protein
MVASAPMAAGAAARACAINLSWSLPAKPVPIPAASNAIANTDFEIMFLFTLSFSTFYLQTLFITHVGPAWSKFWPDLPGMCVNLSIGDCQKVTGQGLNGDG